MEHWRAASAAVKVVIEAAGQTDVGGSREDRGGVQQQGLRGKAELAGVHRLEQVQVRRMQQ